MYTYLKLKNFKSFGDVEFNFKKNQNEVKKLAAIYGENGAGKTNFVRAFKLLDDIFASIIFDQRIEKIKNSQELDISSEFIQQIFSEQSFEKSLIKLQMQLSAEPTEVEYGFIINKIEGFYKIKFHDGKILYEELYYIMKENRKSLFKLSQGDVKYINPNLILDQNYEKEIKTKIDQFWGKYPFLGIIENEINTKNEEYINKNVSKSLLEVIRFLNNGTNYYIRPNNRTLEKEGKIILPLINGKIDKNERAKMKKSEKIMNDFFISTFSEIKQVYYEEEKRGEKTASYQLIFKKQINGKIMDIKYQDESLGTRNLVSELNLIIEALNGKFVIIDEIDTGIHDLLMQKLIESIKDKITGQLIITTHNTLLLETLKKENIYVIVTDAHGNKIVSCIDDYNIRIQKNNNIRNMYLNGLFGGIPFIGDMNFDLIKQELENS